LQDLIYKEFFTQGDLEKTMGTCPIESMDRDKAYIPTLQIQFLDNIVIPLYGCVSI
jgi:cGMP-dependent 3',5'-cyclic phosphodiesterase